MLYRAGGRRGKIFFALRAIDSLLVACGGCDTTAQGPPFPHPSPSSERKESVKGARFLRGLRTLDGFLPFWNMDPEGKGAGVSGGLSPWRSMRRRLMRASGAPVHDHYALPADALVRQLRGPHLSTWP